jgi:hypothetical protein
MLAYITNGKCHHGRDGEHNFQMKSKSLVIHYHEAMVMHYHETIRRMVHNDGI